MIQYERPADTDTWSSSLVVFLGLSLLLLAFFILLNSMARPEAVRAQAAIQSLNATFPSPAGSFDGPERPVSRDGDVVAAESFERDVMGVFADLVAVERQEVMQPGREMMVVIAADSLFIPDRGEIAPDRMALVQRIAAALGRRPPGLRFEVDVVFDARGGIAGRLETARAGALARALLAQGAPREAVAVGLRPVSGTARQAVFWFHVRTEEEARLPFLGADGDPD